MAVCTCGLDLFGLVLFPVPVGTGRLVYGGSVQYLGISCIQLEVVISVELHYGELVQMSVRSFIHQVSGHWFLIEFSGWGRLELGASVPVQFQHFIEQANGNWLFLEFNGFLYIAIE